MPRRGTLRWTFDPKIQHNKTFQHMTCRGVSYHETRPGAPTRAAPRRRPTARSAIFLPTNDGRLFALDAETGKPCDGFGNHGTIDLQEGMSVKTLGFYEADLAAGRHRQGPDHGGAVIDNYSSKEPSGVIRGFDIYTGQADLGLRCRQSRSRTSCRRRRILYRQLAELLDRRRRTTRSSAWSMCRWACRRPTSGAATARRTRSAMQAALVALDIDTGKLVWSYQNVHHDLWDMDLPSQPSLVDVTTARWQRRARDLCAGQDRQHLRARPPRRPARSCPRPKRRCRKAPRPATVSPPTQPFSDLTFRPEREADGRGHVGRHDVRPARLPHHVPSAAL